jgi:hypothetical protein
MGHVDLSNQVRWRENERSNRAGARALAARILAYREGAPMSADERSSLAHDIWSFRKYLTRRYGKESAVRSILLSQLRRVLRYY